MIWGCTITCNIKWNAPTGMVMMSFFIHRIASAASVCVTDRGPSAPARGLWDLGELRLLPKGAVLSLTLLLVWCLR